MRHVIAVGCALVFALVAIAFIGGPVASLVVDSERFESPDEVARLHGLVFLSTAFIALVAGWLIGWVVAGLVVKPPPPAV